MSSAVSPSPRPLSGSLLVIETSRIVGAASQTSVAVTEAVTVWSLWFGGQSSSGDTETVSWGAPVSDTVTVVMHWVVSTPSLTAKVTGKVPVPVNWTVGVAPVAVPPTKGPVHVKVSG